MQDNAAAAWRTDAVAAPPAVEDTQTGEVTVPTSYSSSVRRQIAVQLRAGEPVAQIATETGGLTCNVVPWKAQALIDAGVRDGIAVEADELASAQRRRSRAGGPSGLCCPRRKRSAHRLADLTASVGGREAVRRVPRHRHANPLAARRAGRPAYSDVRVGVPGWCAPRRTGDQAVAAQP